MKKLLFTLFAVVLIVSVFAVPAHASGSGTIEITSDGISEVHPGSDVTFTLKATLPGVCNTLQGTISSSDDNSLVIPTTDDKCEFLGRSSFDVLSGYTASTKKLICTSINGVTNSPVDLLKITCHISEKAKEGNLELIFTVQDFGITGRDEAKNLYCAAGTQFKGTIKVVHDADPNSPDHDWNDAGAQVENATCMDPGTKTTSCNGCNAKKVETIEPLGHDNLVIGDITCNPDAQTPHATVHVKCNRSTCDYYGSGSGVDLTEENDEVTFTREETKDASCGQQGDITYNVTVTIPGKNGETENTTKNMTKVFHTDALEHLWKDAPLTWNPDPTSGKMTVTGSRECERCGAEDTATAEAKKTVTEEPKCETKGKAKYEVDLSFPKTENTPEDRQKVHATLENQDIPATGHDWPTQGEVSGVNWTTSGAKRTIEGPVTVTCKNAADGKCSVTTYPDGKATLDFTYGYTDDTATCTDKGQVTATAKAAIPATNGKDGAEYTFTDTYDTEPLGHDYGTHEPVVSWPDTVDGKADPGITTATLHCDREDADINSTSVVVNKIREPETAGKWIDATYLAPGYRTYTVTAQFPHGNATKPAVEKTTKEKTYELPQLTAPTTQAVDSTNMTSETSSATTTVDKTVNDAVKAALAGGTPAGMDADFAKNVRLAGAGNGEGDEQMTVTTTLEVTDKGKSVPLTHPNEATDATLDFPDTTVAWYAGIDIKVEVKGGENGAVTATGYIHQTADPIQFQFTSQEIGNGPIYFVARHHNDAWAQIPSHMSNGNLVFSSDLFSAFAALSSDSIAYADVTGVSDVTYNGKAQTPEPKVTINTKDGTLVLEKDKDYTLEYSNNVNVGTATITIKALGTHDLKEGSVKTVTFKINAAPASGGSGSGTKNAPNTGDETPVALYAGILTLSVSALAVVCIRRKKSH